ncbi:unnamed protein product [Pieris macdunnoughi]|uniref:Uncharacterized protein n=1 Tax=Pieris macdunnoughi TaxID=345717 RepID=A0A821PLX2_9NEOP|nr:unnamed protein product [Pieris macdunnoughi]
MDQNKDGTRAPIPGTSSAPIRIRILEDLIRALEEHGASAEDALNSSDFRPMDEERGEVLANVFKGITVTERNILINPINVLTDVEKIYSIQLGDELPEDVKTAFQKITSYMVLDRANDFFKIGGQHVFPICFGSENEEVRCRAS